MSYKGFNYPLKARVTRIDDPLQLNRLQVYIPSYHGEFSESSVGYGDDPGKYPWAAMCSILFKDTGNMTVESLKELYAGELPMIFPAVGTVGWVMFEGGDVRSPIYIGSLGKGEVNELVEGMYQGSDTNNISTMTGSSFDIMANIIFEQEGGGKNYANVNPRDVDGISIGLLQWHEDNGRELMRRIKEKNPARYTALYDANHADFSIDKSWKGFCVSKNDTNYNAIKAIISSDIGKACQDEYVNEYLSRYVEQGKTVGVVDFKAQIYFCDMYNQSPAEAMTIAKATRDKSLDGIHKETLNGGYGLGSNKYHNRDRRIRVYNAINALDVQAALNSVTSTTLPGSLSIETTFVFPTDIKNVSVPYIKFAHPTILISESGIEGSEVKAAHTGKAKAHKDAKRGNWIEITSGKYITRYYHLQKINKQIIQDLDVSYDVTSGDLIGFVGHTGNISESGLEFALLINGSAVDPLPYLTGTAQNLNTSTSGIVETAVSWMLDIANDNTHGYSQVNRTGPDYDCTSLPTHGYRAAGLDINQWTYTGNMKANYEAVGFTAIPYSKGMTLLRGDVIFWHDSGNKGHAVTYLGDGQIVSAHSDKDGRQGDSSGNEIDVSNFYETHWQYVMRYEK